MPNSPDSQNPFLVRGPALIQFSGGRSSGMLLKKIVDAHGGTLPDDVRVVFANTGREMPESLDFVQECSERWRVNITWLEYDPSEPDSTRIVSHNSSSRNGEPFSMLIRKRGFLPNPVTRFCTVELKIRRAYVYAHKMLGWPHWSSVIGFRADEMRRVEKLAKIRDRWTSIAPLAYAGITKRDVMEWWSKQPFDLRLPNVNGTTPFGNCDLCFLKSAATIRGIIRQRPELAKWWADAEKSVLSKNSSGARFRIDRMSYAELIASSQSQGDFFDDAYEQSRECNCTD